jgi:hypothetical protein
MRLLSAGTEPQRTPPETPATAHNSHLNIYLTGLDTISLQL